MTSETFNEYAIIRLLGRGGMAEVYEALDPDLNRHVAIKVILPAMSGEPGFDERFRREARMVAGLRHPHIVQIYDFGVTDTRPFMIMEYLPGGTLKERLAELRSRNETMPLAEIARILAALAGALDYAHGRGAIHRDIKPANIIFTADNEPVVADFGIARLLGDASQLTAAGQIVGSPAYMAPEQARGEAVDGRCDQYALGVVLFEMVTGRTPFQGDSPSALLLQHVNATPPPPCSLNPHLPQALQPVLFRALAKQPSQRFPSVSDLAAAFSQALTGEASAAGSAVSTDAATVVEAAAAGAAPAATIKPAGEMLATDAAKLPSPQPVEPPAAERGPRWLVGLLKVASVFAPLVGQQAAPVDQAPRELRGRLAAAMGAIGILLASLQLLIGAFDLISRPAVLLGRVLPYLIAVLLVGGALLSALIARRAPSLQRRRRAVAFLSVIVLVGVSWSGLAAYSWLRPPNGFLVLIADFDGSSATRKGDFAQRIGSGLIDQLSDVNAHISIQRALETYSDAEAARTAGRKRKAAMVIWGAYDDFGITPRVELLRQPQLHEETTLPQLVLNSVRPAIAGSAATSPSRLGNLTHLTRVPLATADLDLFAAHGPEQITYVVSAILATGLYADGQNDDALALFDKALANASALGSAVRGVERVYFQRAVTLHALGRTTEAVADLKKATEIAPAFMDAHYNLAIAYAGGCAGPDGLAQAVAEAETAVRLKPDDAKAHRLLGSLYQQAGRNQDALSALQKASSYDGQDPLTQQLLAAVYTALGQDGEATQASQRAVTLLEAALADKKADAYTVQLTLGDVYVGASQYPQAITAYQATARLRPDAAAPHRGLGNAYYWQDQLDQALAEYKQAAALAPNDPAAPLLTGLILAQQGDLEGAIAAQETAARLSQCDPAPHLLLGGLYFQQDDYAEAAAAYESALALDSTNADAWYVLAGLRFELGDLAATAHAAQEAVIRAPDLVEAQYLLGHARLGLGDAKGALPAAQALVRLTPQEADAHGLLGDVYFAQQQWEDAAEAYEAALALKEDASTRVSAGMARLQIGEVDPAIAHYRAALALEPGNGWAWQSLGGAYQQRGQLAEAASAFEKALALQDSALARGQLAAIYLQQGEVKKATAEYERAASLDPAEPRYQVRLGGLYASGGELARAETAFRAALAIDSKNAEAYAGLAEVAYRQCSVNTAVQSMATAAGLTPTYRTRLATLYESQGRTADAEAIYTELALAPTADWLAHLTVADYFARNGRWDEALRAYQQLLEAGSAPGGYVTSLIHSALGQIDYAQERLFAAGGEFDQAIAAFDANVDARVGLGDLAFRAGKVDEALALYEAALPQITQYLPGLPVENQSAVAVFLHVRRGLAMARQGNQTAAAALDQALTVAEAAVALTPRSPVAQFALATAHLARGETVDAEAAFARASECDQSLSAARTRLVTGLAKLQPPQ